MWQARLVVTSHQRFRLAPKFGFDRQRRAQIGKSPASGSSHVLHVALTDSERVVLSPG